MSKRALIAGTIATALAVTGLSFTGGPGAAAASLPNSQSVGRFVDGAVGTTPIQQIADVQDARAKNPGSVSDQNPLDVKVLNAINLPLTGSLQFQELAGIRLGAVNQVAVAKSDGFSYGASGAVANSGGVSIGGNNNAFPANATINLSAASLAGNSPIPVPGGGSAAALGSVDVSIGAVAALAQTPAGAGKPGSASYGIAGLNLQAASPLLAQLVGNVGNLVGGLLTAANAILNLATNCPLIKGTIPDLPIDNGAIVLSGSTGGLTINLQTLLNQLGLDLNHLAPNTDVIDLLLNYISDPKGLATGLENVLNGLFTGLKAQFDACATGAAKTAIDALFNAGQSLETGLNSLLGGLKLPGGGSALAPLGTLLKKLVDIGINVQPNGPGGTFTSALKATPNQATPVVPGQTVVRAIEIDLVGDPLAAIALANAAAGPSAPAAVAPTSSNASAAVLPTAVPAGYAKPRSGSDLPLVLLVVGLMVGSGGVFAWRMRGRHVG